MTKAKKTKKTNEALIIKIHGILMNGIKQDAGMYRIHGVRIVGANVPTANYMKIPVLMKELFENINNTHKDIITHCARVHSQFEQIHPFSVCSVLLVLQRAVMLYWAAPDLAV